MTSLTEDAYTSTWLSWWLLFMSFLAAYNTVANYLLSLRPSNPTHELYPNERVTPLQCRTFGTWTAITAAVRLQAAYQIENEAVYKLALFTLVVASTHFSSEWLVYGTTNGTTSLRAGLILDVGTSLFMAVGWFQHWYF